MPEAAVSRDELLARQPPPWPEALLEEIRRAIAESGRRLAVLDDDPTGAQTSHDVAVLTGWSQELLARELAASSAFFVLTNCRSLERHDAIARVREAALALVEASRRSGRELTIALRGDSTLRGHFPHEEQALIEVLSDAGSPAPAVLLAPYFREGGRFTVGDVHYVLQGETLVPAGQTEFAHDRSFVYSNSNLRQWAEEKSAGRLLGRDVMSISLEDIRLGGPEAVERTLLAAPQGGVIVVNAAADRDLEVLVLALLRAEAAGRRFVYRTAASFVRVRAGIDARPLLAAAELAVEGSAGGLFVVGSHVERTNQQLQRLLELPSVVPLELDVSAFVDGLAAAAVESASHAVSQALGRGQNVVLFTSRAAPPAVGDNDLLAFGREVARGLARVVAGVTQRPRFLVAKGGNTASELAMGPLGVRRALALGQLLPGVPVWRLGEESCFPGLSYVVFPGNVGGPNALVEALAALSAA